MIVCVFQNSLSKYVNVGLLGGPLIESQYNKCELYN